MTEQNKDWSGNTSIYACNHRTKEDDVAENDLYCTHPESMQLFFEKCAERNFILQKKIYEPCCGLGSISDELIKQGYDVLSTDLIDRGYGEGNIDFLKLTKETLRSEWKDYMKCIVTNPPYKLATDFVRHSLDLAEDGVKVAMFLKIQFLEGKERKKLFTEYPPKTIYVSSSRLLCAKNGEFEKMKAGGGSAVAYAWYVWVKGYKGDTVVKWIN